jgi:multidrug efflux pump
MTSARWSCATTPARLVRLRDIARVELGSEDYDTATWYKGIPAIFIGINQAPGANPLTVAKRVHAALDDIRTQLPAALDAHVPYDASVFIQDSIDEVFVTLVEAVGIVLFVIFLSLGSARAAIVPAVAVPLSLVGAAFLMLLAGFSINLLTLLAMVLAIGLVVDDAIIVVENVHRHIEMGKTRHQAALDGARELGLPIIAMTTTLLAVYAPIGFMGGLVGTLFTEFAFSLAGAVLISGVVALTLSPMLSSKVLRPAGQQGRFERVVEHFFDGLAGFYLRRLRGALDYLPATLLFGGIVLASIWFMFVSTQSELAPTEDQSILFFQAVAPQSASLEYNAVYTREIIDAFEQVPEYHESFLLLGFGGDDNVVFGGFKMEPPSQRARSQMEVFPEVQAGLGQVAGLQTAIFPRPSLPGSSGLPFQFVMQSDADFGELDAIADEMVGRGMASGSFQFLRKSIEFSRPKSVLVIDRDRAADLGITMAEIGQNLATLLGGNEINRFSLDGRSYKVIPQAERVFRADTGTIGNIYLRTAGGEQVPLSSLVRIERLVEPSKRTQFQQLNAVTIEGLMAPGVSEGDAMAAIEQIAAEVFPPGFAYDYTGATRQFAQQGSALVVTFFMSLLVIYLVLAAQFESWRDPFIILVSVPMSIAGAMVFLTLGFATMNIYTQVGLITLIGLIAKNGILLVEFANQLQLREGLGRREAIEQAARIRLRPILMTTVAMLVAMIPLLTAAGPGAVSRFHIGLVIATGLGIGTLFTLFIVPAVYLLLARDHQRQAAEAEREAAG